MTSTTGDDTTPTTPPAPVWRTGDLVTITSTDHTRAAHLRMFGTTLLPENLPAGTLGVVVPTHTSSGEPADVQDLVGVELVDTTVMMHRDDITFTGGVRHVAHTLPHPVLDAYHAALAAMGGRHGDAGRERDRLEQVMRGDPDYRQGIELVRVAAARAALHVADRTRGLEVPAA